MNGPAEEPKHYLVQRIREALAHDHRVAELELSVTVRGDKVFLAGTVPTADRRDAATEVAREAAPDHEVHNAITVGVHPEPDEEDEERLQ